MEPRLALLVACLALLAGCGTSDQSLLDANRTALVVIDVQADFLTKLPLDTRNVIVDKIGWMMRVAAALAMPIVATAEDFESGHNPGLLPKLAALLPPPHAKVFNKLVWNGYGQPDIKAALDATGRDAFLLVGLETDVCVMQTALGLQDAGFRVAVIEDACGSAPPTKCEVTPAQVTDTPSLLMGPLAVSSGLHEFSVSGLLVAPPTNFRGESMRSGRM